MKSIYEINKIAKSIGFDSALGYIKSKRGNELRLIIKDRNGKHYYGKREANQLFCKR